MLGRRLYRFAAHALDDGTYYISIVEASEKNPPKGTTGVAGALADNLNALKSGEEDVAGNKKSTNPNFSGEMAAKLDALLTPDVLEESEHG